MMRPGELVDHLDAVEAIAAIDEDARVAREGRGIAGNADQHRRLGGGECLRLFRGAGARRIEDDGVVAIGFLAPQRLAIEIAAEGFERQRAFRLVERADRPGATLS